METIVDTLCNNMLSDKEQLRDISSIGKLSVAVEKSRSRRCVDGPRINRSKLNSQPQYQHYWQDLYEQMFTVFTAQIFCF